MAALVNMIKRHRGAGRSRPLLDRERALRERPRRVRDAGEVDVPVDPRAYGLSAATVIADHRLRDGLERFDDEWLRPGARVDDPSEHLPGGPIPQRLGPCD